MILSSPNKQELDPRNLPEIWPLKPFDKVTFEDRQAFKEHIRACNAGDTLRIQAELLRCKKNIPYWVMTHTFTKDEHDGEVPVKRFPRKLYIVDILKELCSQSKVAIPKSRQIMITWTCVAYLVAKAIFWRHRLIFLQSKKEDDAAMLIDRAKHIYEHLPWWMKSAAPLKRQLHKLPFNKLILANGSLMWGVPQGADVLRQYTASIIFGDESAFQEKAEDAYKASKPTTDGGGQSILVSSVNGKNFFYRVCYDKMDVSREAL
jgi:hypothetical protein